MKSITEFAVIEHCKIHTLFCFLRDSHSNILNSIPQAIKCPSLKPYSQPVIRASDLDSWLFESTASASIRLNVYPRFTLGNEINGRYLDLPVVEHHRTYSSKSVTNSLFEQNASFLHMCTIRLNWVVINFVREWNKTELKSKMFVKTSVSFFF